MAIAEFNSTDGLPPLVVSKLNHNFRNMGSGGGGRAVVVQGDGSGDGSAGAYAELPDKPSIEDVTLVGNNDFPDLGIFKTDENGYDVPDDYSLTSMDINAFWASAQPIGG